MINAFRILFFRNSKGIYIIWNWDPFYLLPEIQIDTIRMINTNPDAPGYFRSTYPSIPMISLQSFFRLFALPGKWLA